MVAIKIPLKHIHWLDREYVDSRGSINTNILTNSLSYIVTPSDYYYVGAPSNPSGGTV